MKATANRGSSFKSVSQKTADIKAGAKRTVKERATSASNWWTPSKSKSASFSNNSKSIISTEPSATGLTPYICQTALPQSISTNEIVIKSFAKYAVNEWAKPAVEYAQNNYTQGNGTAQIGISGTAAFFSGMSAERGITWDNKGNIGVYSTKSGTAMAGVSLSAGVSLTFTTAPTVEHLNGWGGSAGLSGGEGLVGGADYIFVPGDADQAFYSGGSVNIGAGVGTPAEMHVNAGKTEIKSINIFDQLYDLFDTIEKW